MADVIRISDQPQLYDTLLIAAFSGWNDAADAATTAVRYLDERLMLQPFATIDPEDFYVFSDTRPQTRLNERSQREITWPTNQFSYLSELAGQNRSLVTLLGVEPDLKWQTFSDVFFELCKRCNVTEVILLGSLLAPVPHTRQVPLSGFSTTPEIQTKLRDLGVIGSRYEGPTGIVGVLTTLCQERGIRCGSLWGATPSYLSASPNWKVTSRLLTVLNDGWKLDLELEGVQSLGLRFETQVSEAVNNQDDVASFVRDLEEHYDESDAEDEDAVPFRQGTREEGRRRRDDETEELPSAELLIQELEKHLKLRREDEPPGSERP
jgi:proteasome assembly chaperone (PAC2) family protein